MARKRKKRSVRWRSILLILLVANTSAGLYFSPVTAAQVIRVEGVELADQDFVRRALQRLWKTPYIRANPSSIESNLGVVERIEVATLDTNVFGRGVLKVTYRKPVASVVGATTMKLSVRGDLYSDPRPASGLPSIQLPRDGNQPNLTLAFPAELRLLADISARVSAMQVGENWVIEVEDGGRLCLNKEGSGTVVLGSSENLDQKFGRLRTYMSENPGGLEAIKELNLTVADKPTVTPLESRG
ncbi:MAG: hypothetical protein WAO58_12885 [Fimbriimonadaceae bacterium]